MDSRKKRSRADREAPMADTLAPIALATNKTSSASKVQPNSSSPSEVLDLPNTRHTSRRRAFIAANLAIAKAAQYHDKSDEEVETGQPKHLKKVTSTEETRAEIPDEEVETGQPKRLKKVTFTEETRAEIPDGYAPTLISSTSSTTPNVNMTEVRARAARHKGQMNFEAESMSTAR